LQSITPIDSVGLLSKLSALRDQVAHLPLFALSSKLQMFHAPQKPINQTHLVALQSEWKKTWQTTLATFKSLVIIRNRQNEISPLISVTQEEFLRQNLQLIFQQAQWAVLQQQQAVYQYSLTQANEWIQRYFADNDHATLAMQADINQLQQVDLAPPTPDIDLLITQLHRIQLQINKGRTTDLDKPVITHIAEAPKEASESSNHALTNTSEKGELV
jgi:uroporphyrin-3 C-methyltransferase